MTPVDIPTARGGTISSVDLGTTLMHEHVFLCDTEVNKNWPGTYGDEDASIAQAVRDLKNLRQAGIDTIVDVSVIGHGRDIHRVAAVAREVDVNILVATGVFTTSELPPFFRLFGPGSMIEAPESMTDYFVRDIEEGIGDTGVRAAILKVATGYEGVTNGVERTLRAVAQAHSRTGVPITTHTATAQNGRDQQRIFAEEGVDLSRVIIGHTDFASGGDVEYIEELISNGSYVGFDTFGLPMVETNVRIDLLTELIERGHADKIVVAHDHACFGDFIPAYYRQMDSYRKTYFSDTIVPLLATRGITADQVRTLTVTNPRRIFEAD